MAAAGGAAPRKPAAGAAGPRAATPASVLPRQAERLGFRYLDTGAMYRALAWLALERGVPLEDGEALAAAAEEGDVGFLAEALAERAGIDGDSAWDHMLEGGQGRFVLLLRMANVSRDLAARLLAGLGDLLGISDLGREIARFEEINDSRAGSAQQWLRLDPSYRAALQALGSANG
ncbi:MAG: (d)CMP kinase [Actinobacteria bacterium]|nr:(d)CMP kinase [Actinomycetota bacterium]